MSKHGFTCRFRLKESDRYENIRVEKSLQALNFNTSINFNVEKVKGIAVMFSIVDISW